MTTGEIIVAAVAALGGGGGIGLVVKAFRERHKPADDRPSTPPQRHPHVTHPELAAAMSALRAEFGARVDAAETDCDRGREELARRQDGHYQAINDSIRELSEKVGHALGRVEGVASRRGGR